MESFVGSAEELDERTGENMLAGMALGIYAAAVFVQLLGDGHADLQSIDCGGITVDGVRNDAGIFIFLHIDDGNGCAVRGHNCTCIARLTSARREENGSVHDNPGAFAVILNRLNSAVQLAAVDVVLIIFFCCHNNLLHPFSSVERRK